MKFDARDEARWECPPLPKDLDPIPDDSSFWMTPDKPVPRKGKGGMLEHEKRWNFRMVPGHATVDEVLGEKEFWKYKLRKVTGPDGWLYELISVLHSGSHAQSATRNLDIRYTSFLSITRFTKLLRC